MHKNIFEILAYPLNIYSLILYFDLKGDILKQRNDQKIVQFCSYPKNSPV